MTKLRHVLGISGGKDSAALAIYMKNLYPLMDIEYYCSDTGKELDETYDLITNLETYLGQKIEILKTVNNDNEDPFDHYFNLGGGYLPSSFSRWCTQKLKLEPFEDYIGDDYAISYVGIRGDEDREGYISTRKNIQSIFPFRKNIWSAELVKQMLHNENREIVATLYEAYSERSRHNRILQIVNEPISFRYSQYQKQNNLLNTDVKLFNKVMFEFLKIKGEAPIAQCEDFPLVENEDVLIREDIFRILKESGVGVPAYYNAVEYEINGEKGVYSRSRSGCYFCFFQQKIEWVWLYEQHPDKFAKAINYEKEGYTWMQDERLEDLIKPERIAKIKADNIKRAEKAAINKSKNSTFLLDRIEEAEGEGCAACFV